MNAATANERQRPPFEIRPEHCGDQQAIHELNERAFGRAGEADLVDSLRRAGALVVSLVAAAPPREHSPAIFGHIAFSPVEVIAGDCRARLVGLAPMAVFPGWQSRGIGAALIRAGLHSCASAGYEGCVVLGHARYYPRFGFRPAHEWGLASEYDVPQDVFMAQELAPGALAGVRATVSYHPAFAEVT